jgi:peptidoglycan L-alanyl-D-glutamate endopeptidase CwlK
VELRDIDLQRLGGVHPDLVRVVLRAAEFAPTSSFIVTEGLRNIERQKQLVEAGKSRTMNSRHLTGHAVDLAVWIDQDEDKVCEADEISWKYPLYVELARAVQRAALLEKVPVVWGACWSRIDRIGNVEIFVQEYKQRKLAEGGKPFIDSPHFELDRTIYD